MSLLLPPLLEMIHGVPIASMFILKKKTHLFLRQIMIPVTEMNSLKIHWLQERFPKAEYEDVTGLCKLASPADLKEQDYSLNPGRYVGVVIEEDGKTEVEFVDEVAALRDDLELLNAQVAKVQRIISHNIGELVGD